MSANAKVAQLVGLLVVVLMGCAIFIAWRLQRLKVQQAETEQRAAAAFEEMNKITKELREQGKVAPADPTRPAGERLKAMYPGPKHPAS